MGLTAIPFAVDMGKVQHVFGSKDRGLFEKIKTANLYDTYASQSDDFDEPQYRYNFDKALEDIIFNYLKPEAKQPTRSGFFGLKKSKPATGLDANIAHGYGYVLLVVCDYVGTHLLPHCDGFYYGRDFEAAVGIMKENGLRLDMGDMFEQHDVFDIPKNDDFPAIKHFTKEEIAHINAVMDRVAIDESKAEFDHEDFDEVQEMLMNIRDCFRYCREHNLDMVTFTH